MDSFISLLKKNKFGFVICFRKKYFFLDLCFKKKEIKIWIYFLFKKIFFWICFLFKKKKIIWYNFFEFLNFCWKKYVDWIRKTITNYFNTWFYLCLLSSVAFHKWRDNLNAWVYLCCCSSIIIIFWFCLSAMKISCNAKVWVSVKKYIFLKQKQIKKYRSRKNVLYNKIEIIVNT